MLIKCPECGKQISDKVEACPNCGAPQPASLRTAALEKRRVARRRTIRIVAIVLVVTALAASTTFAVLYRWPVSYEIGTVTGTDIISREDLVKAVDAAAAAWNRAAGRTVAWRLPLGKRVRFDVKFDASLQEYLTTLADLEYKEAALWTGKKSTEDDLNNVRVAYDWSLKYPKWNWSPITMTTPSLPTTGEAKRQYMHGLIAVTWWGHISELRPTLKDVKRYEQAASTEGNLWKDANDRLQSFKKTAKYTDDPSDIDAGVTLKEGSPTTVVLTYLSNTYTLTGVLVHQFGHVLLGAWGANDSPSIVTATPLKSPWRFQLFGRNSQ